MTQRLHVYPQLVGAACDGLQLHARAATGSIYGGAAPAGQYNASYTCPAGRNLVGNGCVLPGATFAGYACDAGTLSGNTCIVSTTSTVAPGSSNASDRTLSFLYGPEHQRIKQNVALSGNGTSAYFSGNTWYLNGEDSLGLTYEKEVRTNGTTEHKHYVNAAGFTFALFTSRTGTLNGLPATTTSYFHKDHLGSVSVIADETGAVTERLAYDPWGKRRFINTTPGLSDKLDAIVGVKTDRGYTEHEHLDEVGVVHMNGRVYDPLIGRFMSADPKVTDPRELQSFNRYSYVWNNPLRYTDPTGFDRWASDQSGNDGGASGGYGGNTSSGLSSSQASQVAKDNGISTQAAQNAYAAGLNAAWQAQLSGSSTQGASGFSPAAASAYASAFNSYVAQNTSVTQRFINSDGGVSAILNAIKQISSFATLGFSDRFAANMRNGEYGAATGSLGLAMLGIVGNLASDGTSGALRVAAKGTVEAANVAFKTTHYAPRLEAAGLNVTRVESAVAKEVDALKSSLATNADAVVRLKVDGVLVEYRARLLENGTVNVGTVFPVK